MSSLRIKAQKTYPTRRFLADTFKEERAIDVFPH